MQRSANDDSVFEHKLSKKDCSTASKCTFVELKLSESIITGRGSEGVDEVTLELDKPLLRFLGAIRLILQL